jgi:hypothetical protein
MGNLYGLEQIESYSASQHVNKHIYSVLLKMQRAKTIQNCSITYTFDSLKTNIYLKSN